MSADHVRILDGGIFHCAHCGARFNPYERGPVELWAMSALAKGFVEQHEACEAGGYVAPVADSPQAWLDGDDCGRSSRAILHHMIGRALWRQWNEDTAPCDPADFGRCFRLLAHPWAATWRARMGEMAERRGWAGIAPAWDELEALYREEVATGDGRAPRLYARMCELRGE